MKDFYQVVRLEILERFGGYGKYYTEGEGKNELIKNLDKFIKEMHIKVKPKNRQKFYNFCISVIEE